MKYDAFLYKAEDTAYPTLEFKSIDCIDIKDGLVAIWQTNSKGSQYQSAVIKLSDGDVIGLRESK